jgi:hypothetical protein
MLQSRDPCRALAHPHGLVFLDAEVGEQDAAEDDGRGEEEDLHAAPEIVA